MRRILFQETDFNALPNPPAGFKYIGFDGPDFSIKQEDGQISESVGATGPQGATGSQGPQGPTGPAGTGASASTDRLISPNESYNLEVILDSNGTLNVPVLLPVTFMAVCDINHMIDPAEFADENWWVFEVEFGTNPNGEVETLINNIFPIQTNPGYLSGYTFRFTESDHGIPGFNFEIQLNDVVLPGGAGWTANLSVTMPPIYPSTVESLGAIKLTSNSNSLVLGTLGDLTIPGTIKSGNSIDLKAGDSVTISTNTTGVTQSFTFNESGQFTLPSGASIIESNFTGADGQNAVLSQYDGLTQVYTMQNGVGIQTHDSGTFKTWTFDSTGDLTLPQGGDIKNYLGNSVLGGGGISINEVTYSELKTLVSATGLSAGSFYKITDFRTCYDQPDFDYYGNGVTNSNTYHQSEVDPIIVFATSDSTLDPTAYQPSYPNDKIKYDVSWTQSEVTGGTAYGRITERIDEFGNRLDYDHRTILFKRYKTRFLDGTMNGRILSLNDGIVVGTNSTFTGDFASGSVVFIESDNPNFYKVLSVTSDTEMTVEGRFYNNFSDAIGYPYESTRTEDTTLSGCLYYFNDSGDNDIDDGGDDMYDGANRLNTNLYSQIPYTHTQMNINGQAQLSDFTYDGTVQDGSAYFGASSSYFTNTYPGLFVMSAYGVDVTDFSISGNLGSDGDGQCEGDRFEWEGFTIFTKIVHSAAYDGETDPSIVHIIIVDTIDANISHSFDDSTSNDDDSIGNLSNVSTIHYLLFGLSLGVKPTNQQIQNVYQSYLDLVDNFNINQTLSSLNSNFSLITNNLPANQRLYKSLNVNLPNIIGDELDYREMLTFDSQLGVTAKNNYFGNNCDSYLDTGSLFMLPNNVFTDAYGNSVEISNNNFGDRFYNNSFGNNVSRNTTGRDFINNKIYGAFERNTINDFFAYNIFHNGSFSKNIVGINFSYNLFMNSNTNYNNEIGNDFSYNRIFSNSSFYNNVIPFEFNSNRIFSQFYSNQLSYFNSNTIYDNFYLNICAPEFTSNTIGNLVNTGAFSRNNILSNFQSNTIGVNFSFNTIGNYFSGNTIGDDFGFGGGQARGNRIGNYFTNNTIGEYFYDNITADVFQSNIIGNNFRLNDIKVQNLYNIDFTTYQGNIISFIDNLGNNIPATDGVYIGLASTSNGGGQNATFDVTVAGGFVTLVQLNNAGKFYTSGENLQIATASFNGSGENISITVTNETIPVVYMPTNTTILKDIYGVNKLQYLDTSVYVYTTLNGLLVP